MWKTVEGYETYEVSDTGNVKNVRTGKILGRRLDKNGYLNVYLYSNGKGTNKKVHRLVADAFLARDSNRDQINHKNGIKDDNRVGNLEWCTRSENTRHAYHTGLLHSNMEDAIAARRKISDNDIVGVLDMRSKGFRLKDIARRYDMSISGIHYICSKGGGRYGFDG